MCFRARLEITAVSGIRCSMLLKLTSLPGYKRLAIRNLVQVLPERGVRDNHRIVGENSETPARPVSAKRVSQHGLDAIEHWVSNSVSTQNRLGYAERRRQIQILNHPRARTLN